MNMNIMGWVYNKVADGVGSPGHTALGTSLMIGKYYTFAINLLASHKLESVSAEILVILPFPPVSELQIPDPFAVTNVLR